MGGKTSTLQSSQLLYNKMLIIGGCELSVERNPYDSIEVLDFKTRYISKFPYNMIYSVRSPMAASFNNKLYIFGGCRGQRDHISDVQIYDLESQNWQIAEYKMLKERSCFMLSQIGSEVYIMGGYDGFECLREVEKIDLAHTSPEFKQLKPMYQPIKNGVSYFNKHDGFIYIVGGWDEKETQHKLFKYHPIEQEMEFVCFLPYKIEGHSITAIDDKYMFVFGGFDSVSVIDSIMRIDIQKKQCLLLTDCIRDREKNIEKKVDYLSDEKFKDRCRLRVARENSTTQFDEQRYIYVAGGWGDGKSIDVIEVFEVDRENGLLQRVDSLEMKLEQKRNRPCSLAI